ncbi:MAG: hypothetical protein Q9160_009146 [Pyrenula sp. 1 TL-2023]
MSHRNVLCSRCLIKTRPGHRSVFRLTQPYKLKYSTQPARPIVRRKWRDVTVSLAFGFVAFTAYAAYRNHEQTPNSINPINFSDYVLVQKQSVSTTSSIFTLSPIEPPTDSVYYEAWKRGIWSVEFKQPQLQIARAYTPLPPTLRPVANDAEDLRFLIRKDPEGEVSSYLHNIPKGSGIDVRGPNLEYEIPQRVRKVLFLAGGTGIAPALQAAYCLLEAREGMEETKIHILWAGRRREDCLGGISDNSLARQSPWWKTLFNWSSGPATTNATKEIGRRSLIVQELDALKAKHPGRISIDYFVDEERSFITDKILQACLAKHDHDSQILLSGPDGFISCLAGPKTWSNGRKAQGHIGGALQRLEVNAKDVWKL